jgi:hypothetical protein
MESSTRDIRTSLRLIEYNSGAERLFEPNAQRVGIIIENDTDTAMYVAFGERTASEAYRNFSVPARSTLHLTNIPFAQTYKGPVTFALGNATAGRIFATELTHERP